MTVALWFVQTVQVSTRTGSSGYGDQFAPPVSLAAWVEEGNKVVVNSEGAEQVSSSRVFGPTTDENLYQPGSKVTLPSGRPSRVIQCARFDSGPLALGDHVEVSLV